MHVLARGPGDKVRWIPGELHSVESKKVRVPHINPPGSGVVTDEDRLG